MNDFRYSLFKHFSSTVQHRAFPQDVSTGLENGRRTRDAAWTGRLILWNKSLEVLAEGAMARSKVGEGGEEGVVDRLEPFMWSKSWPQHLHSMVGTARRGKVGKVVNVLSPPL